jgi:DNA polymerase III subunit delta'
VPLPAIVGHEQVRTALGRAVRNGSLAQSILLYGPRGAGKERLGLWLAGLLVCERAGTAPCGHCPHCRLVDRLEHPDVHWFFPLPRPEAASPDKLRDKLEEQRAAELQQWRDEPFRVPEWEKPAAHFLAAVRTIQHLASVRPALGRRKVFVIGDADLMVPQESSPEAANALLKLLEEPPPETTLVLTSSFPGALLPTIRSRLLAIRAGRLAEDHLRQLLESGGLAGHPEAASLARRARGSARRAFRLAAAARAGAIDAETSVGRELLVAVLTHGAAARLAAAHARRPAGARSSFLDELDAFAEWLRDLLAVLVGAPESIRDPADLPILRRAAEHRRIPPEGVIRALARITEARELALGNVNPQLILADLLAGAQRDLQATPVGQGAGR